MLDVRVDQAEEDELERRNQQGQSQSPFVAEHLHGFLLQDRAEAPHAAAPLAGADSGAKASTLWLLGYFVLVTIGELYLAPIGLALIARIVPLGATGVALSQPASGSIDSRVTTGRTTER